MVKLVWRGVALLLVTCLALVAGLPGGPPKAFAAPEPAGCTKSGVPLFMESSTFDSHLGQTVTFRTQISNSIPGNCDLANMIVTLTTPDGVEHVVATDLYVSAGTETPWYEVSYVIAAGNLVNNEVVASARASGLSRLNDRTVTGTASSSVRVTPVVGALAICTQGAGPEGPAQIAVSGTTTDAPGGSGISVSVAGASTVTTTALDGTWSVAMAWNGTGGSANVTAAVSFGDGNTGSVTTALVIPAVQMNGGESVTSMSKRPVISGTTTGSAVTVTIGGTSVPVAANGGTWSLTWPTDLAYGSYTVRASVDGACALDTQGLAINNTAPAATDDAYSTLEDTTLNVPAPGVLANDIDLNGDPLTAVLVEAPLHGTLALDPSGSFVYTPAANYHGSDSFKYKANDGMADSYQAIVTITIGSVDDQPAAVNDAYSTPEDMTLTVPAASGVLANDSDADGDAMAADKISNPSHGTVTLNPDGSLTYQPDANFNGTDTFRYIVNAGGNESNVATVTITVGNANDPPVSEDKEYSTDEDVPLVVTVPGLLRDAIDPDGDPVTAIKTGDPAHGTVSVNPDGSFTYTPALNYFGSDSFTFMVNDGTANSNESTVFLYVAPVNDAPVAVNDTYSVEEDGVLNVTAGGLLGNDTDVDGGTVLQAVKVSDPAHGTVTVAADGTFVYTPAANYHGTDSFTYKANDGKLDSNVATVTITVEPTNDPPVAAPNAYSVNEGTTLTVAAPGVLGNDSDPDGDSITAVVKTFPAHGSLGMGPDGSLTYTPENGFVGTDTFTYAAFDGTGESMPVTVTITVNRLPPPPQNSQPFANHDAYTVDEDGTLTIAARGVLLNDTDPDGDVLSALLFSGPAKGTLALNANGSFIYTPAPLFHGTDTFKYRVSDGSLVSNVATVTITVRHVNHAPVATDDAYSVNQDAVLTVQAGGVLGNDTDVDKDALTALLVAGPAHGTVALNADGSFQYTPAAGYHGPDSFRYQAFDGAAKSNVATAAVSIRPGAPPVAKKPTISGVVIDAATGQVIAGATVAVSADFDADGTPDFTESVQTGADGRYKIEVPRSEWTYTAIVSTPVTTAAGAMTVVTSHTTVVPKSETGGVYNAERKIAGQIYLQAGPGAQMMKPDQVLSKGVKIAATLLGPNGAVGQVQVNDQGLFEATGMPPGQYKVAVKVTAPDGTALAGTAIGAAVTGDGELVVGSALINPGSRIFDAVTKLPVDDVTVTLYWADTPLNKLKGRTPDTVVSLPMVPVFLPGMNHVPATSAGGGVYAWLVHPDGDYYIIAEKLGYRTFDSRTAGATLHVDAGLLKYDFEMEPVHARFIRGYPDGTFKPEQQITRAEVAAILARIVQPTKVELPAPPFGDVSASHWAATYIELVRQKGLMMGDPNGNFRPEDAITRAELATILARFKSLQLDAPNPFTDTVGHWAEAAISAAYRVGLITGYPDGTFHPQALTNRAEAATMINRMLGRGPLAGRAAPTWPDVPFSHWASGQVEEASSSHSAVRGEHDHELWTSDTGVPTW